MSDIGIEKSGHVALVEIRRPPNNFFDIPLIKEIAGAFESFDTDINIRAVVLAAQGKAFGAGPNLGEGWAAGPEGRRPNEPGPGVAPLYGEGKPPLSYQKANYRGDTWGRRWRRPRACDGG